MKQLAIIGAGVAGLAAAQHLRVIRPDLIVTVLEKSRGVGGRAATRSHGPFVFDHGAQYIKAPSAELQAIITTTTLLDLVQPVWVLHADNQIKPGDPAQNRDPKWTYADGITRLGKHLAQGIAVRTTTLVGRLAQVQQGWEIFDREECSLGEWDAVLLTPPAPQLRQLIAASSMAAERRQQLDTALAPAVYRRCLTLSLGYAYPINRPWYALINSDRQHPIAWLAREHAKPDRAPAGSSLLVVQMAPTWSTTHWDHSLEAVTTLVHTLICTVLDETLPAPMLTDRQGWRYALPDGAADGDSLYAVDDGLFWAGDYMAGQGRVHSAIESGWAAAKRIAATL